MLNKSLTLSLVIPVFNEERYLSACLASIAAQSELPDEVIVVDNNSTDGSVEIAKRYKFVTVLHEKKQHQAFAQKTGLDYAKGEILGRIDGDSVLPPDWVSSVKKAFQDRTDVVAVTGTAWPYDVCLRRLANAVFRTYNVLSSFMGGTQMLWGANCAIRRAAWIKISNKVLQRGDIWEDTDMSFLLARVGKIRLVKNIRIGTSFRAVHKPLISQLRYQFRSIRTFYFHRGPIIAGGLFILWFTMIVFFPIVLLDSYVLKPLVRFKEPY